MTDSSWAALCLYEDLTSRVLGRRLTVSLFCPPGYPSFWWIGNEEGNVNLFWILGSELSSRRTAYGNYFFEELQIFSKQPSYYLSLLLQTVY